MPSLIKSPFRKGLFDFPFFSNEDIKIEGDLCSRVRFPKAKCFRCEESCPKEAINLGDGPSINEKRCNRCGVCIATCLNGVYQSKDSGDKQIISDIWHYLNQHSLTVIELLCNHMEGGREREEGMILFPCLGRLTEGIFLSLFLKGVKLSKVYIGGCKTCQFKRGIHYLNHTISLTKVLLPMVDIPPERIQIITETPPPLASSKNEKKGLDDRDLSRREFFKNIKKNIAKGIYDLSYQKEKQNDPAVSYITKNSSRRTLLISLIREFGIFYPCHISYQEDLPFSELIINEGCVGCKVCETLCPSGAIKRAKEENDVKILFSPYLCHNCKICREVCLPKAIEPKPFFDTNTFLSLKLEELIKVIPPPIFSSD